MANSRAHTFPQNMLVRFPNNSCQLSHKNVKYRDEVKKEEG